MILVPLGPAIYYRALAPRWSFQPLSGAGAAKVGGRFNAKGVEALYLSQTPALALREYAQADIPMPPATICAYAVKLSKVVDFTGGFTTEWAALWQASACNWRGIVAAGGVPPSWDLGEIAQQQGASGLLFRSMLEPSGINLVVFMSVLGETDVVAVHDPEGRLPKSDVSWR